MKINNQGLNLIKKFEGFEATAYKCPAGINTIGYGATFYADGKRVSMGDKISEGQALQLLLALLVDFEKRVDSITTDLVNENQFSALVSFAYNCGCENLRKSTLLKKVNANPNDPTIALEFAKWNKGGGKVLKGLTVRRKAESDLYFS
jgi:lysozyme